ncbi:hypothetical protein AAG906_024433 [Vitis piasezkii]
MFNLSSTKSSCDFIFHKEALEGKGVCDACGEPSKCLICGNKENSDGFSGWYYISAPSLEEDSSKIDTVQHPNHGNQKRGHETGRRKQGRGTGTRSREMQPSQDTKSAHVKAIGYIMEVAVELLNIIIPLIFGIPPLPLGLLLKLLK